jgi:hypothetical protein
VFHGISVDTWNAQSTSCNKVLSNSINRILDNPESVTMKVISIVPLKATSSASSFAAKSKSFSAASTISSIASSSVSSFSSSGAASSVGVNITYSVAINPLKAGFHDELTAYHSMTTNLLSATSNGAFNTYLTYYAASYQIPEMFGVTTNKAVVVSVDSSSTDSSSSSDASSDSSSSTTKAIGIAFAVLASLTLLGVTLYYGSKYWKTRTISGTLPMSHQQVPHPASTATRYSVIDMNSDSTHSPLTSMDGSMMTRKVRRQEEDDEIEIELSSQARQQHPPPPPPPPRRNQNHERV